MTGILYIACFILGMLMTFHASMNARVSTLTGYPVFANLVFWVLGAAVAVGYFLIRPAKPSMAAAIEIPIWLYAAGIIGAVISLGVIYTIPRVGIAGFTILILAGQLVCSGAMGAAGILSETVTPIGPIKIIGYVLVAAGSYLVLMR